jgi:uncharacterized metal-binding protein YceD (DUF177 family)
MTPEFSRPIRVEELSPRERSYEIEANESERAGLAKRFDLQSVDGLSAALTLNTEAGGRLVRLKGRFDAKVVQSCVITLEPVPAEISNDFEVVYERNSGLEGREVTVDSTGVDVVPLEGEVIDIGEAVAEELSLSLDPYPKAPGAVVEVRSEKSETGHRPFEILARLKAKH